MSGAPCWAPPPPHQATTDQPMEQQKYDISFQFYMGKQDISKQTFLNLCELQAIITSQGKKNLPIC